MYKMYSVYKNEHVVVYAVIRGKRSKLAKYV